MQGALSGRWAALADLGLAAASGTILWFWPRAAPWALALALLPWLWRISQQRPLFQRTPLDLSIVIFLVTAAVAAWASYDHPTAFAKLCMLAGAVFLFYALAGQPRENFLPVVAFLSGAGAVIAIYFLLASDWQDMPADLGFINLLGMVWMAARPSLGLVPPQPNIAGGLIALFLPFNVALLVAARKTRQRPLAVYTLVSGGLATLGLLMTSSRAAWLALGLGISVWLLWELSGRLRRHFAISQTSIFAASLVLLVALAVAILLSSPGGLLGLAGRLPGADDASIRLAIYAGAVRLARAFPFTGGGLHAFSGLYSQYILGIPFFMINYAHNLYLDLAVEQGLPALAAFLLILAGGVWLLLKGKAAAELRWAILASTLVILAHGTVDDPLYGGRGTPFLLILPALGAAIYLHPEALEDRPIVRQRNPRMQLWTPTVAALLVASMVCIASLAFIYWRPLLASGYANLGAVRMAQVELADFPSGRWQDGSKLPELARAEALLVRANQIDPGNVPASYRLGLIAMLRRDYVSARGYLENAYAHDPGQRGVRKALGYCYVWLGDFERGGKLLAYLPGARGELQAYATWWGEQGRPDLAEKARKMVEGLGS
jgi:O-antigen ligase